MFVPTASAFRRKTKEKEFRRPTQNPIRKSKSLNKNSGTSSNGEASGIAIKRNIEAVMGRGGQNINLNMNIERLKKNT